MAEMNPKWRAISAIRKASSAEARSSAINHRCFKMKKWRVIAQPAYDGVVVEFVPKVEGLEEIEDLYIPNSFPSTKAQWEKLINTPKA
jgi:hypothetical protein